MLVKKSQFLPLFLAMVSRGIEAKLDDEDFESSYLEKALEATREYCVHLKEGIDNAKQ
jgi:hypothetical protein